MNLTRCSGSIVLNASSTVSLSSCLFFFFMMTARRSLCSCFYCRSILFLQVLNFFSILDSFLVWPGPVNGNFE
jgi:hypothetical protein